MFGGGVARAGPGGTGSVDVVRGLPQLDVRAEQGPDGGARRTLAEGEPDAARVDAVPSGDGAVELEVRVPGDDHRLLDVRGQPQTPGRRGGCDQLRVAARRSVENRTGPSPTTSTTTLKGIPATNATLASECCRGTHASLWRRTTDPAVNVHDGALPVAPDEQGPRQPGHQLHRTVGFGTPEVRSPHETTRSTPAPSISARTAVSAGTFAWTSETTATRRMGP